MKNQPKAIETDLDSILLVLLRKRQHSIEPAADSLAVDEAKTKLKALLVEARIGELLRFNLPQYDHSKCLDPKTCIGYENAQSDFDNKKELRLAELKEGQK